MRRVVVVNQLCTQSSDPRLPPFFRWGSATGGSLSLEVGNLTDVG